MPILCPVLELSKYKIHSLISIKQVPSY